MTSVISINLLSQLSCEDYGSVFASITLSHAAKAYICAIELKCFRLFAYACLLVC